MTRPVGVTILAVIAIVYGIFRLLLTLLGVAGLALAAAGLATQYSTGTLVYASVSDLVLGLLFLAFGIGALRLKGWAWATGMLALVLEIVGELVSVVMRGFHARGIIIAIFPIVVALLLCWYLLRRDVRSAFGKAA